MNISKPLQKSEIMWSFLTQLERADEVLNSELREMPIPKTPERGWLKTCREGLLLSLDKVSARLEISRQACARLEKNEVTETLTLEKLRVYAEALDCEFVYWVRPKNAQNFSQVLWRQILGDATKLYKFRMKTSDFKPGILAKVAADLFKDPAYRRKKNWVRN
jgi:transcriptional regulator with XRE-family HTH domain